LPSVKFDGGYAQASLVLTGETHTYNSESAAYNGVVPANPFSLSSGGWGAWEIAGRISVVDLNDQLATANGVAGGKQTIYTAGLNWRVNRNVRFMFNYLHGDIAKEVSATNAADIGAKINAFAMRTQVAF
jgi:phosphate-selective porin OprO and OprP